MNSSREERAAYVAASAARFGAWVKRLRGGRSQAQIAGMLANMTQGRISGIERGKVIVSAELACEIADALGQPDIVALTQAGYVRSLTTDDADAAVLFASLTGERREIARQMLVMLAGMEQGRLE